MNIENYIALKKKAIDKALDKYLPPVDALPQVIHRAMRYSVFSGGKRIRPILTITSFEACGGKGGSIMPVACAIELIHTYTLIHDDLPCMDNDDYRRGKLTCHRKFSETVAVLAGDALLPLGFELLSEAGNMDVIKEVSKAIGTYGTAGGQAVDIEAQSAKRKAQSVDLDYITEHKTGSLFEAAIVSAGILKGVSKKKLNALKNFAKSIGFTFQLIDDLMDGDGYVELYGDKYVRDKAGVLTEKAKKCLGVFGSKAAALKGIADLILERKS